MGLFLQCILHTWIQGLCLKALDLLHQELLQQRRNRFSAAALLVAPLQLLPVLPKLPTHILSGPCARYLRICLLMYRYVAVVLLCANYCWLIPANWVRVVAAVFARHMLSG